MATKVVSIMLVKDKGSDKFKCVLAHSIHCIALKTCVGTALNFVLCPVL
jgi:hypothetical protein